MSASDLTTERDPVTTGRRLGYWIGMLLAVAGFGTFAAVFATAVVKLDQLGPEADTGSTLLGRMVIGMLLMIAGSMLMRMGLRGRQAELDPRRLDEGQDEPG